MKLKYKILLLGLAIVAFMLINLTGNVPSSFRFSIAVIFVILMIAHRLRPLLQEKYERSYLSSLDRVADDLSMPLENDKLTDLFVIYDDTERAEIIERLENLPKGNRILKNVLAEIDDEYEAVEQARSSN